MDKTTALAIKRLENRFPLIGSLFRAKGARALINTEEQQAVLPLIQALKDKSPKVQESATLAINSLKGRAKDHLCSLWAEKRDRGLEEIITRCGYVASEPAILAAYTTFLNQKELAISLSEENLTLCLTDSDKRICQGAVDWLIKSKGNEAYNILWDFAKDNPQSNLPEILREKNWYPEEPVERALFYFLANDLVSYHDIDFEQSYLRIWYETSEQTLKETIASRIRKSGDARLLTIFRTARGSRKAKHTYDEVELQIGLLTKSKNYPELFQLLRSATYEQGMQIIAILKNAGWRNPDSHGQRLQERLEDMFVVTRFSGLEEPPKGGYYKQVVTTNSSYAYGIYQDFRPMFLGTETPPEDEAGLLRWVDDKNNFRHRSAGVILLAEKGYQRLSDVANRASGDAYWQVRMAAAAAELLRPQTLSPANKALLERDHVYWVQAILKMPSSGRLVELTPKGLEELKGVGHRSSPNKKPQDADNFFSLIKGFLPSAEREYLLTLGEFLGTDVVVSEEVSYEAGERDVEIVME